MADSYPVPAGRRDVETEVRRSRFLAALARAPDPEAARAFLAGLRLEHPSATHHCYAFVAGPPGDTARIGAGDDGEPRGTAGRPMLNVLLHCGVGEIVAVVTRWFGGVKLGTGGLSRAYAGAVQAALAGLPLEARVDRRRLRVGLGHAHVAAFLRLAREAGAALLEETYGEAADFLLELPEPAVEPLRAVLRDLTRGEARLLDEPS